MTDQLTLPIETLVLVEHEPEATIQERFEAFHKANPWVYSALVMLTRDWLAKGHQRVGMKMLAEVVRWQYARTTSGDSLKLNNNFTSRYARLLIEHHPEFGDVFTTRELRAA